MTTVKIVTVTTVNIVMLTIRLLG